MINTFNMNFTPLKETTQNVPLAPIKIPVESFHYIPDGSTPVYVVSSDSEESSPSTIDYTFPTRLEFDNYTQIYLSVNMVGN